MKRLRWLAAIARLALLQTSPGQLVELWRSAPDIRQIPHISWPTGVVDEEGCADDADLAMALKYFGQETDEADCDGNGRVDEADLYLIVLNFGLGCERGGAGSQAAFPKNVAQF